MAKRVIQHSPHILGVDEKTYKVIVTEHRESLDPDKVYFSRMSGNMSTNTEHTVKSMNVSLWPSSQVIPRLSATVDYSQLPGGVMALTSLHKSHPDIQINYDAALQLYTFHGTYSKVQAALTQLLGHPGGPQSAENKDAGQPATSGSKSVQIAQKPHTQESEDLSRKPNKQIEQREKVHIGRTFDEYNTGSHRDLTPGGYGWEDTGQREGAALQLPGPSTTSEEDFLLIVDADMFRYLQKHCRKEYQQILSQYDVDVVDMTNQGLTSLFLQVATGVGEGGRDQECLKLARKAISSFFQENETKIRRAQIPKSILSSRGGLQRAKENLSVRLPKLLLNEDDRNIYIIGGIRDVSEAKQFLLDHSELKAKKEDVASLLRFPSYDSGSSSHADEQRATLTTLSTVDCEDDRIDQILRSEEDEKRAEGARRYKLAARFKDSGLAALGNRPTDFSLRGGLSSPSRPKCPGPVLGYDVLSETVENAGERVSRASAQILGGDILFKSGDALPSAASMQNKTSMNSNLVDTRPKSITLPFSTTRSQSGSTPLPPAGSGSTLKRASSFSGTPQQKAQVMGQRSQDDTGKSTVKARTRSSSFSNQTGKDKQAGYNADITVSFVMWQHIKEAYSTRVDDLTSDVQMKESHPEGSIDLTVTLRGANPSEVSSCRLGLQKLVDSVSADFCGHELRLSELGITDAADETLQACCADVRSRFKKVTTQILKNSLFIFGPKQLCSQVGASLREVFSGDFDQRTDQQEFCTPSTSNWDPSTFSQTNEDQIASLHGYSNPQVELESHTSNAGGTGSGQQRRTNNSIFRETELVNGSISQPLLGKDPVIKEKVKLVGTTEIGGQKAFINTSKTGNDRSVNGIGSTIRTGRDMALSTTERTLHSTQKDSVQQRHTEIDDTPEEPLSGLGGLGCICVCGESEKLMMKTKCGATLCSKCLDIVHVHCRVCHETEPTSRGIQGKMSHSKLHISVPGYKKDSAIKITYWIPDGIQEVRDLL